VNDHGLGSGGDLERRLDRHSVDCAFVPQTVRGNSIAQLWIALQIFVVLALLEWFTYRTRDRTVRPPLSPRRTSMAVPGPVSKGQASVANLDTGAPGGRLDTALSSEGRSRLVRSALERGPDVLS
jgi:hypothetical protein